ncbi:MAG: tetratricopeptide repeat protein [Mariniblastus sp.]|nr:tetratricopeptide repeat protein [Mariniblastus sp.]
MFIQKLSFQSPAQILLGLVFLAFMGFESQGLSQDDKTDQSTAGESQSVQSGTPKISASETRLVRSVYELTKTTKSAKELSNFIAQCEAAQRQDLVPANHKYVTSLKGWALNLRGGKRLELSKQLKLVGNSQHATSFEQAMSDFDEAIVCDPERYRSWMSRGIAHAESENFRKAALDFTNVVKMKTELSAGWFNRAESLYHLKQFEAAIDDYQVAISLDSDDAQSFTGRGHCQFALGNYQAALTDYKVVAELVPENPMVYINLGDALQRMEKWEEALVNFEKSLSIKHSAIAYQRSAWLKATSPQDETRNAQEAVQLAKRAIRLAGDSAINLDTLAAAEAAVGNFEVAKKTQAKVVSLVDFEEDVVEQEDIKPYKARLALYQQGKAFTQAEDAEGETEGVDSNKDSDR